MSWKHSATRTWPKPKNQYARELYDEYVAYCLVNLDDLSKDSLGPSRGTYTKLNRWADLTETEADEIWRGRYYTVRARRMYPVISAMDAEGLDDKQISERTGIKPKNVRYILRKGASL